MHKTISIFSLIILLVLSACQLPAPVDSTPAATEAIQAEPTSTATEAEAPAEVEAAPATEAPQPTEPIAVIPTSTSTSPPPTQPPEPTATQQAEQVQVQPTATSQPPTNTPLPKVAFDPEDTYGEPTYENRMTFPNLPEWANAETQELPNNRRIWLRFDDGELVVTGKQPNFSTWWFSYHTLSDFYVEMAFNSGSCSGSDAYGVIFRGPPHLAGESYGYVVAFTCDGDLWAYRLDDADPFSSENLINFRPLDEIDAGSNRQNVIGVRAEGDTFTIVANGTEVAEVSDDVYDHGRVGVFVQAGNRRDYTYRVTNFAYWDLSAED